MSSQGSLSDVWSFDGIDWTWISGSRVSAEYPVYGVKGVSSEDNRPPGGGNIAKWVVNDTLYLYGGSRAFGLSAEGNRIYL